MDRVTLPPVPAVISISGLTKTYASGLQALKRVDLEIRRGEIFALLGPNGASADQNRALTSLGHPLSRCARGCCANPPPRRCLLPRHRAFVLELGDFLHRQIAAPR